MKYISLLSFLIAFSVTCFLLMPGVWWPDSLNAFIQQKTGYYGAAQPPILALLCGITSKISPTSLPLFVSFVVLYSGGLAWLIFSYIKHKQLAAVIYFAFAFFPLSFAAIGVVQTETLQAACLAMFVPACLLARKFKRGQEKMILTVAFVLLALFSLARYESIMLCIPLSYLWMYSIVKEHSRKTILGTVVSIVVIQILSSAMLRYTNIDDRAKGEMQLSLLVCDIAAISVESNQNYVPDFCWQPYLSEEEKTVQKIAEGYYGWKGAFYSYNFNVDPSIGIFGYDNYERRSELYSVWVKTILTNPHYYLWYHTKLFAYLLTTDYFNMGLWGGVHDAKASRAKLVVEYSGEVSEFIKKNSDRFSYKDDRILFNDNETSITDSEVVALKKLVSARREQDVIQMQWISNVPSVTYMRVNPLIEKILLPAFDFLRWWFRFFCTLAPYCFLLFVIAFYACKKMKSSENRFYILLLSACGLLHIALRFVFLTDTVFRFGLLTLIFLLLVLPIFIAELSAQKKSETE